MRKVVLLLLLKVLVIHSSALAQTSVANAPPAGLFEDEDTCPEDTWYYNEALEKDEAYRELFDQHKTAYPELLAGKITKKKVLADLVVQPSASRRAASVQPKSPSRTSAPVSSKERPYGEIDLACINSAYKNSIPTKPVANQVFCQNAAKDSLPVWMTRPPCRTKRLVESITWWVNKAAQCMATARNPIPASELYALIKTESSFQHLIGGRSGGGIMQITSAPIRDFLNHEKGQTYIKWQEALRKTDDSRACWAFAPMLDESTFPFFKIDPAKRKRGDSEFSLCSIAAPQVNPARNLIIGLANFLVAQDMAAAVVAAHSPTDVAASEAQSLRVNLTRAFYNIGTTLGRDLAETVFHELKNRDGVHPPITTKVFMNALRAKTPKFQDQAVTPYWEKFDRAISNAPASCFKTAK